MTTMYMHAHASSALCVTECIQQKYIWKHHQRPWIFNYIFHIWDKLPLQSAKTCLRSFNGDLCCWSVTHGPGQLSDQYSSQVIMTGMETNACNQAKLHVYYVYCMIIMVDEDQWMESSTGIYILKQSIDLVSLHITAGNVQMESKHNTTYVGTLTGFECWLTQIMNGS